MMMNVTKKLAKKIAAELKGIEGKSPAEQMATYFAIGFKLREVIEGDESTYGQKAMLDIVALVPDLKTEQRAYEIMAISCKGDEVHEFILKESTAPMGNGQHLTVDHWRWLFRHQPEVSTTKQDQWSRRLSWPQQAPADEEGQWLRRELAWLRKESPSPTVLEHVEEILESEHQREVDEARETVQRAIRTLELL